MDSDLQALLATFERWTNADPARWKPDADPRDATYQPDIRSEVKQPIGIRGYWIQHADYRARMLFFDSGGELDVVVVRLESADGDVLRRWIVTRGMDEFKRVRALAERIGEGESKKVIQAFAAAEEPVEGEKHSRAFLSQVADVWDLVYEQGNEKKTERLRIDEAGNYFYVRKEGEALAFILQDVYFDADGRSVSFSKLWATGKLKGKLKQNESLRIGEDWKTMSGFARHDGHSVRYTRVEAKDRNEGSQVGGRKSD